MCDPATIAIGAGIGAATSAATGQDPLMGAVIGGVTAGYGGLGSGSVSSTIGGNVGLSTSTSFMPSLTTAINPNILASSITQAGVGGFALSGLAAGAATSLMFPQYEYPDYVNPQPLQTEAATAQNKVTGSGGTQASALLASEIKRVKRARAKTQTSALNTQTEFPTTGLQLA